MTHYLITGGAGFIGSHLVEALLKAGHRVTVLDDLSTGKRENLPAEAQLIVGNICDSAAVTAAMHDVQGCFHLAAVASVTKSIEEWASSHQVNQGGAVVIFDAAAKRKIPVVYASSAAVYGDNPHLPLTEDSEKNPLSPYGLDKFLCEWQAAVGARCHGLKSAGMRFFNVYGARQDPKSPYSGVISIFMEKLKQRQPLTIYGDGAQSRDFIYVADVVAHLQAAMQALHSGHIHADVFNVCTGIAVSVKDLATLLREISGSGSEILFMQERPGDIRHSCGSNFKARQQLTIEATTELRKGLTQTWQDFL